MIGGSKCGLEERAEIVECSGQQLLLRGGEISAGFGSQHFEGIDHRLGSAQVDLLFAAVRIGDLAKEKPGVLGLENDEFIEPGIGFGRMRHVVRVWRPDGLYKREDGNRASLFVETVGGFRFHRPDSSFACLLPCRDDSRR